MDNETGPSPKEASQQSQESAQAAVSSAQEIVHEAMHDTLLKERKAVLLRNLQELPNDTELIIIMRNRDGIGIASTMNPGSDGAYRMLAEATRFAQSQW